MRKPVYWLVLIIALGVGAFFYFRTNEIVNEEMEPPALPQLSEPAIRYPIEAVSTDEEKPEAAAEALPELADSDAVVRQSAEQLIGAKFSIYFYLQQIVRRIVITVDNLPLDYVSPKVMPVKPVGGWLVTQGAGENLQLSPKNADRYTIYVELAQSIPPAKVAALYVKFYPLFQEQYEKLGYPGKYFNDRVVQVLDHLLSTPEAAGPIALIQPRVLYQYADPELEKLSAGQKMLIRMGRNNSTRIKVILQEIRRLLAVEPTRDDAPIPAQKG